MQAESSPFMRVSPAITPAASPAITPSPRNCPSLSNGVIAGDGVVFCAYAVLLSDTLLRDGQFLGDGVIAGDTAGVIAGDTLIKGDDSACMPATPDQPL